jgi:hypothetical protein
MGSKNLLHEAGEILDKPIVNQEKALNGVNNFINSTARERFVSSN